MTEDILTVNELFSGIGAQRKALDRLGIAHEVVGVCEIDKYAIQSYEAIFGKTYNYGDICTAERLEYADLWTYSFPCQDISVAGRGKGISSETRSGLLYQVQRLLEVAKDEGKLPKYLLLENVKNLVGKKFKSQFDDWLFYLDQLGYDTYWQVLNAKHYGIPQNRERVFAISIRKDLNKSFEFPKPEELTLRLKDILEDEVDEKYYLSQDKVENFIKSYNPIKSNSGIESLGNASIDTDSQAGKVYGTGGVSQTLCANTHGYALGYICENEKVEIKSKILDVSFARMEGKHGEYDEIAPTLTARDYKEPRLVMEVKTQNPVRLGNIYGENMGTGFAGNVWDKEAISPALMTMQGGNRQPMVLTENIRIRKLTPLECWRLMGFDDEDFYKAQKSGVSNTQLYKQAGNSIVVNVLEKIFENLCK